MTNILKGKRIFSILLTLCMIASLFAGLSVTASAETENDSWVGADEFNYDDATAGSAAKGWTWKNDGTTATLTLSGVNITAAAEKDAIRIAGSATIVLEGANKVTASAEGKHGLYCYYNATLMGSGTLEAIASGVNGNAIYLANGKLSIKS